MATGGVPSIMNVKEESGWFADALGALFETALTVGGGIAGSMMGPQGAALGASLGSKVSKGITGESYLGGDVASAIGAVGSMQMPDKIVNPFTSPDTDTGFGKLVEKFNPADVQEQVPSLGAGALDIGASAQPLVQPYQSTGLDTLLQVGGETVGPKLTSGLGAADPTFNPLGGDDGMVYDALGNLVKKDPLEVPPLPGQLDRSTVGPSAYPRY